MLIQQIFFAVASVEACFQISDETSLLQHRAQERERRQRLGVARAARGHVSHGSVQGDQGSEGT